jgi:hypothetical protein
MNEEWRGGFLYDGRLRDRGGFTVGRKLMLRVLSTLVVLMGCFANHANAAPRVVIAPQSDTVYVIQGMDLADVSGLDITIRYDPAALDSPRIAQGSLVGGALMAANVSSPGMARLALVRTVAINGSGPIATVAFSRIRSTGAEIQSLTASALSSSGSKVPVGTDITNSPIPPDSGTQAGGQDTNGTTQENPAGSAGPGTAASAGAAVETAAAAAASTKPAAPGILAVPASALPEKTEAVPPSPEKAAAETDQPGTEKAVPQEESQVALAEKPAVKAPEQEREKVLAYPSVLDRFKDYKGNKSPQSLMALFSANPGQQDPPLVLSDGKTTVRVMLELDSKKENNNFLLEGVSLVSLRSKEGNRWIAELLPDRKTLRTSVSVPKGHQLNVMPLNVAPPLEGQSKRLTEADFRKFLQERGTDKSPQHDLNNDGKRDYIDDYIFTANYVVQQQEKSRIKKSK